MAYKSTGTAGKSASGASMSKYDVEVEARLKKLETTVSDVVAMVNALQAHEHDVPTPASNVSTEDHEMLINLEQTLRDSGVI